MGARVLVFVVSLDELEMLSKWFAVEGNELSTKLIFLGMHFKVLDIATDHMHADLRSAKS